MLKFAVAALWICAVTVGSIMFAFSASAPKSKDAEPAYFGGLDYVKTEVLSIPVIKKGAVQGYFLSRIVYTVDKERQARLSVPGPSLIVDQLYAYLYANPLIDFTVVDTLDLAAMKEGIRTSINKKLGEELIHEILIEQVDYLSKADIRDNNVRRKTKTADEAEPASGHDAPAEAHATPAAAH